MKETDRAVDQEGQVTGCVRLAATITLPTVLSVTAAGHRNQLGQTQLVSVAAIITGAALEGTGTIAQEEVISVHVAGQILEIMTQELGIEPMIVIDMEAIETEIGTEAIETEAEAVMAVDPQGTTAARMIGANGLTEPQILRPRNHQCIIYVA